MTQDEALAIFQRTGALQNGHFKLRSGLHSRQFFQCAKALQWMPDVEAFGAALAKLVRPLAPATIIAPAMGGLVIGQEVARQLGIRFIFVEKADDRLTLRRGFTLSTGEKVVIIEDVVTKGGRVRETMNIVGEHGGELLAVAVLVDRSNGTVDLGVPFHCLIRLKVETFEPEALPADLAAIPASKPGS